LAAAAKGDPFHARAAALAGNGSVPVEIMWMPAGTHEIHPTQNGKPITVKVTVDRTTAATMEADRAEMAAGKQKPYFDFNHQHAEASAWPVAFLWRDQPAPGVYARVEWTAAGRAAIEGKTFRAFSPAFYQEAGKVIGAPLCMGGLVNDPAFQEIQPIWAARAASTTMNKVKQLAALITALNGLTDKRAGLAAEAGKDNTAALAQTDKEIQAKRAEIDTLTQAIEAEAASGHGGASNADNQDAIEAARLRQEVDALKAQQQADRTRTIDSAVQGAITAGRLAPQDTESHTRWKAILASNLDAGLAALNSLQVVGALNTVISPHDANRGPIQAATGEDLRRAVQAYAEIGNLKPGSKIEAARARAERFRAISKAMDKEDGMDFVVQAANRIWHENAPIQAANSLGTLVGTLVTQKSLQLLKFSFPELTAITTDFSAEAANYNQTITTRTRAVPAVNTFTAGTGYGDSNATDTDVSVTINTHKGVQITFTANDLASTRRLLFGEQQEPMHYAIGLDLVNAVTSLFIVGNYANKTVAPLAQLGRPSIVNMSRDLNKRGVPPAPRSMFLYSDAFAQLATDPTIVTMAAFSRNELITKNILPDVAGFKIYEAPYLSNSQNSNIATTTQGFGFTPDAVILATRVPNDYASIFPGATGGGVTSVVTNPDTGLSLMLVEYVDHNKAQATMRLAWMYGVAVGQASSGQLLATA
jgi:hypothetical protein